MSASGVFLTRAEKGTDWQHCTADRSELGPCQVS